MSQSEDSVQWEVSDGESPSSCSSGRASDVASASSPRRLRCPAGDALREAFVPGSLLAFKDPELERAYLNAKFEESKWQPVFFGVIGSAACIYTIIITQVYQKYRQACAALVLMYVSQYLALLLVLLPLAMSFSKLRAETIERVAICVGSLLSIVVAFPMNQWRTGYIWCKSDGMYLYDRQLEPPAEKPSDVLLMSWFYTFSLCIGSSFIRARRVWIPLATAFLVFICSCGLVIPGISPEPWANSAQNSVFMALYFAVLWRTKLRSELADRLDFERRRLLEVESQRLLTENQHWQQKDSKSRYERRMAALTVDLEQAVESEDEAGIAEALHTFREILHVPAEEVWEMERKIRRRQSEERGVRLSYLLSDEFQALAQERAGMEDPTFHDLKLPFFMSGDAIGSRQVCPRDGKVGCALVDTLGLEHRSRCTHFLSWAWNYRLSMVRGSLQRWAALNRLDTSMVSFYMCFFVNNQYRILTRASPEAELSKGSDSLESTFERSLLRAGRVVALLDTFDRPLYLTRIWTIFEQFKAHELEVPVEIVMPQESYERLIDEFKRGEAGIGKVRKLIGTVDSSSAKAWDPADERKVKEMIEGSVGFKAVDDAIKSVMKAWVGSELKSFLDEQSDTESVECFDCSMDGLAVQRLRSTGRHRSSKLERLTQYGM